ncbi:MAG TPA: restriction endonuclease subunit S [Gaiellaceae bacterium]
MTFVAVEDLFETRNGYTPSKADASNWTEGTVPWFRMEDIRENGRVLGSAIQQIPASAVKGGRLFPANSIIVATSATIGEHALITVPFLSNQRFTALWLKPQFAARFDVKFVFYYCFVLDEWCRNNTTTSSFASVDMDGFRRFRFPLPPLEVQREIVKILDGFTELQAELRAELEARRWQYRNYRDALLTFPAANGIKRTPIGEFAELVRGNGLPKTDFTESGVGAIHYGQIYTYYGTWADETKSFVAPETAAKLAKVDPGDVVITNTSENIEDVGKAVAWLGAEQVVTGGHATVIKHSQNPKFLAYYFQTAEFSSAKRRYAFGTKVIDVSAKSLAKIDIPLPSRNEQDRIVSILDKFDSLVNDLSIGLPAELNARRKQYEYYRDRLLTFPEAA